MSSPETQPCRPAKEPSLRTADPSPRASQPTDHKANLKQTKKKGGLSKWKKFKIKFQRKKKNTNLNHLFYSSMLCLLLLRIPLCLLPRIYLRSQTKIVNNINNKPQTEKKKNSIPLWENKTNTAWEREELYYGLKREGDELSDDPTTGAGEPIDQSVGHNWIVHANKSTSRKRSGTKTKRQS